MKKTRLSTILLSVLTLLCSILIFASCGGDDKCTHRWGEWSTTTNATCTEAGTQKRNCSKCGETETTSIDVLGHDWKDATCTEPKTCVTCKKTEGSAKGHTGGTSTCESKAQCSVCSKEYGYLAAHIPTVDDGDCTTSITCSVCGEITTPANASHIGGNATCQNKAECTVCGTEYGILLDHAVTYHEAIAATCTTNGNIEYWSCAICNKNYSDADATTEVVDVVVIASHTGGTEIRNYKAPTEHEDGYTGDTYCLGCQQMISRGVVLPAISNKPTIIACDAVVEQSEDTVKIMIFIENNPGIVSLKFDVLYSDILTIQSVEFDNKFGAYVTTPSPYINPQTFNWISFGEDETSNGCFVTITFSINSEVTENTLANISIILDNANIFDSEMNLVKFDIVNATVTIKR